MGVTKESFGFLEDKREAFLYTIENQNGFAVKVTDFGVNIVSLLVKTRRETSKMWPLDMTPWKNILRMELCLEQLSDGM